MGKRRAAPRRHMGKRRAVPRRHMGKRRAAPRRRMGKRRAAPRPRLRHARLRQADFGTVRPVPDSMRLHPERLPHRQRNRAPSENRQNACSVPAAAPRSIRAQCSAGSAGRGSKRERRRYKSRERAIRLPDHRDLSDGAADPHDGATQKLYRIAPLRKAAQGVKRLLKKH